MRMLAAAKEIELQHLYGVARIAPTRHEITPFAMQIDEREIDDPVHDEHPHHREVPVPRAGEPTTKSEPVGNRLPFPRIAAERLAASRETGVRVEDAKPTRDHDRQCD